MDYILFLLKELLYVECTHFIAQQKEEDSLGNSFSTIPAGVSTPAGWRRCSCVSSLCGQCLYACFLRQLRLPVSVRLLPTISIKSYPALPDWNQLTASVPDATSVALVSADLKGAAAGEYLIQGFDSQSSDPF